MCARSFKEEGIGLNPVYQEPVGLNMAVAESAEVSGQCVVSLFWIKRLPVNESNYNLLDFSWIFTPSNHDLDIFFELVAVNN